MATINSQTRPTPSVIIDLTTLYKNNIFVLPSIFRSRLLPFPIGIGGADNAVRLLHEAHHAFEMVDGFRNRRQLKPIGQHGKRGPRPVFPGGIILFGARQCDKVAISPGDGIGPDGHVAVVLLRLSEGPRDIEGHTRFYA